MNRYRVITLSAAGETLFNGPVEAISLDMAAGAMKAALRQSKDAIRSELWLADKRVSVIIKRAKRLVMVDDKPSYPAVSALR